MRNLIPLFFKSMFLIAAISSMFGCVAYQGFTVTARAGDTVTFAIGSLDNVTKSNVQLAYFSDSNPGVAIDITSGLRSIVRLYPDKTSASYWEKTAGVDGLETIKTLVESSWHGPWQTVAVVDLPTTLPAGSGYVKFIMGAGVVYPLALATVDNVDVALTILAHDDGTAMIGASHDFGFKKYAFNDDSAIGDLNKLEPLQQVVVKLPANQNPSATRISAANYELTFNVLDSSGVDVTSSLSSADFAVVLDDLPLYISHQVSLIWKRSNSVFNISIISPAGPINPDLIRFSVVLANIEDKALNGWSIADSSASLQAVKYYDVNGNEMAGPSPFTRIIYN